MEQQQIDGRSRLQEILDLEVHASEYAILAETASSYTEVVRYRDLEQDCLKRVALLREVLA